jgi:hypothetical protein
MSGYVKRLKESEAGGYLAARIDAVHTYACPWWRMGRRHGPCDCGANALLADFERAHGQNLWAALNDGDGDGR